jgi:hypothetical protein
MRAALLASLVFIGLIALSVRTHTVPASFPGTFPRLGLRGDGATENRTQNWIIDSRWKVDPEDADQDALDQARDKVVQASLQSRSPIIEWKPPLEWVQKLVKKRVPESRTFDEQVGPMHRVRLEIEWSPQVRAEVIRLDREHRSQQRMIWLAKVLGMLVTLLAAVAGYVHLDERTKGYYTNSLRFAVASIVVAVGAGLWWIS